MRTKRSGAANRRELLSWTGSAAAAAVLLALGSRFLSGGPPAPAPRTPAAHPLQPVAVRAPLAGEPAATPGETSPIPPLAGPDTSSDIPPGSYAPLPASLQGTEVDGSLEVRADGSFRATRATRHLFDYFFLASGEESPEVIRGRILLQIQSALPPSAQADAIDVLDRYIALQRALRERPHSGPPPQDAVQAFEKLRALRRSELGADIAQAFYGKEETMIQFEFESRAIRQDPSLSAEEQERRLRELERRLPQPEWEALKRSRSPSGD